MTPTVNDWLNSSPEFSALVVHSMFVFGALILGKAETTEAESRDVKVIEPRASQYMLLAKQEAEAQRRSLTQAAESEKPSAENFYARPNIAPPDDDQGRLYLNKRQRQIQTRRSHQTGQGLARPFESLCESR